jgi:hypothetical protein
MHNEDASPTVGQAILRLGTLFAVFSAVVYAFCCMFTQTSALERLTAYATTYPYERSCDVDGNFISFGRKNCVNLARYVFFNGPVMKAYRRAHSGKPAAVLTFEVGKITRTELASVRKHLEWHARFGRNTPC